MINIIYHKSTYFHSNFCSHLIKISGCLDIIPFVLMNRCSILHKIPYYNKVLVIIIPRKDKANEKNNNIFINHNASRSLPVLHKAAEPVDSLFLVITKTEQIASTSPTNNFQKHRKPAGQHSFTSGSFSGAISFHKVKPRISTPPATCMAVMLSPKISTDTSTAISGSI